MIPEVVPAQDSH